MHYWYRSLELLNFKTTFIYYKSPTNQTYWWNFGALALYFLIVQLIIGILLAMFYDPSILFSYSSIMYINNEIYYGWWIRSLHANGASFFFLCVYIHMFRGLYYGSFMYLRQLLWKTGILLFALMIAAAFLGYVLPWGQMSFWAAMVITSLVASVPIVGTDIVFLLWGGFSIEDVTLHRFYVLYIKIFELLQRLATGKQSYVTERSALNKWKNSSDETRIYFGFFNFESDKYINKDRMSSKNVEYFKLLNIYNRDFRKHFDHPVLSLMDQDNDTVNVVNLAFTKWEAEVPFLNEALFPLVLRNKQCVMPLLTKCTFKKSAFNPELLYKDVNIEYLDKFGPIIEYCEKIGPNLYKFKIVDIDKTYYFFSQSKIIDIKSYRMPNHDSQIDYFKSNLFIKETKED